MPKPWMSVDLPIEKRVAALLAEMTLAEKIGQMNQIFNINDSHIAAIRAGGVGSSLFSSGAWAGNVRDSGIRVRTINQMQKIAVEQSRLGIPILYARDVIHGYRTMFPIPLGQAASWDPDLVRQGAAIAAHEASAIGIRWTFAPMMDIARDPRWGRVAEGYGEDPYLASRMAEAAVQGFQGDDLSDRRRVAACAKHYVAYGLAEGGRDYNILSLGPRLLRDVYLPPFRAAVKAGVATVMTSFNEIDGIPTTINRELVTGILKKEWGFDGFVVTDWDEIGELLNHGVASDREQASQLAVNAGTDMEMVGGCYVETLEGLVNKGAVSQAIIDEAVGRILTVKFRLGLFECPFVEEAETRDAPLPKNHRSAAREAAARSAVLLKNNGVLPLRPEAQDRILLTGQFLTARAELFGTWTLDARADDVTTIEEALQERLHASQVRIKHFPDEAVLHARYADVAIACVGEHPLRSGEANSVTSLGLPAGQLELLKAIHAIGTPLVVVILAGRPLCIPWIAEHADAVVYMFHPGVEGGNAIADILTGVRNPAGRLPMSFPRSVGQTPVYYNSKPTVKPQDFAQRSCARYADSPDTPLFPFGFGLSYTSFEYTNLWLEADTVDLNGTIKATVDIANTGSRDGDEVVQAYVRDLVGSATRPFKELKAFRRIHCKAGETRSVAFNIPVSELAFTTADMRFAVEPGQFYLWIGPNAREGLRAEFRVVV